MWNREDSSEVQSSSSASSSLKKGFQTQTNKDSFTSLCTHVSETPFGYSQYRHPSVYTPRRRETGDRRIDMRSNRPPQEDSLAFIPKTLIHQRLETESSKYSLIVSPGRRRWQTRRGGLTKNFRNFNKLIAIVMTIEKRFLTKHLHAWTPHAQTTTAVIDPLHAKNKSETQSPDSFFLTSRRPEQCECVRTAVQRKESRPTAHT